MLEKGHGRTMLCPKGSEIREPVYIEENVTLKNSIVGPNVSLGAGTFTVAVSMAPAAYIVDDYVRDARNS